MFTLNKTIYYLILLLLLELSLLGGLYFIIENFFDTKVSNPKVLKLEVLKVERPNEKVLKVISYIKKEPAKKVVKIKVKSLEDVLVHLQPSSELDIVAIKNQMVKPIIYTKSIKLSDLSIELKKKAFIDMLIPSILVAKHRMLIERKKVAQFLNIENISPKDSLWLTKKRYIFKAKTIDELYDKMELHPTSIVIAQAIIESGWGTSRFFEKANNVFGIWSFNEHEKRIAASEKRGKKTVYLKKYSSVEQSISDYFLMLSTKDAYKDFRAVRLESQDPFVLIKQLEKYSELGQEYIENLKNTIEKNKLLAYDSYSLDI
jgi:Bax protein